MITVQLVEAPKAIDQERLTGAVTRGTERALSRFGAYLYRVMRNSLKYRNRRSQPGEPPTAWRTRKFTREKLNRKTGQYHRQPASPLRELIAFAVVNNSTTQFGSAYVIIGPMIFRLSAIGGGQAPRTLEVGGTGWVVDDDGKLKMGRFAPRPFVKPAFRASLPRAPKLFEKVI